MKILHLIDSGGLYGAEIMLLTLMEEQIKANHGVYLISCGLPGESDKKIEKYAIKLGINVIKWRIPAGFNRNKMKDLSTWLYKEKFDVVHSHGYKFNILCAFSLKKINPNLKLIATVHGYVSAEVFSKMAVYQLLDRIALFRFDHIALVNDGLKAVWPFKWLGKKVSFVPNGLKANDAVRAVPSNECRFLAIGRLSVEKQFETLVKCISKIDNASLTIMGEGPKRNEIEALIEKEELKNRVFLKGFVNNPVKAFSEFDALIISSSTEGLPMVLLEAMRSGLPIISTPVGAIPYVLGADYPYLASGSSNTSLLEVIVKFTDCENHKPISELITSRFKSDFTSVCMHESYQDLYESTK